MSQVVLITGCSTGIGRDLVQHLKQANYTVVATARHVETLADLSADLKLPLDVTCAESIAHAVEATLQQFGRIDVLVNNAGYAVPGAIEDIPDERMRQLFDVNVFGTVRLIRAVLPGMRQQRAGRIINLSSIAGRFSAPVDGLYSASKFALEALSDALRLELLPFGIHVTLIEPGPIRTEFARTALAQSNNLLTNAASPYHTLYQHYLQAAPALRRNEPGPEVVSRAIQQAIETPHPKARYLVATPLAVRLLIHAGATIREVILKRFFKISAAV
jgi:NAD(P)-dependent dehydrogenase (short-subunit alcohol dehydrogenase family)